MSNELASASASQVDQWRKAIFAANPELWEAVVFVLELWQLAGIVKQNTSTFDLNKPNCVAFYVKDCLDLGITPMNLRDNHDKARRSIKFWPSSGEFANLFAEFRASGAVIPAGCGGYVVRDGYLVIVDLRSNPDCMDEKQALALLSSSTAKAIEAPKASFGTGLEITDEDRKRHEEKVRLMRLTE